jgi:hypothetical protein
VWEVGNTQKWAKEMKALLEETNRVTNAARGECWKLASQKNTGKGIVRYCKMQKQKALPLMKQTVN